MTMLLAKVMQCFDTRNELFAINKVTKSKKLIII